MNGALTRRDLIWGTPGVGLASGLLLGVPLADAAAGPPPAPAKAALWPGFPRQDPKLVAEVVGMAHRDEARVKELVKAHPALVNACWDWGFGDWETPLGAASHTGRQGIAEFLLKHGARIDIFAAAMLGMTDTVKAFVAAQPGVQRTLGPHGITLLAHAKAGGKRAAQTVTYLEGLGDADIGLKRAPLPEERKKLFVGTYKADKGDVRLDFRQTKTGQLLVEVLVAKERLASPQIHHLGKDEFFPSGVPSVRLRFTVTEGKARLVTLQVNDLNLTATRVEG